MVALLLPSWLRLLVLLAPLRCYDPIPRLLAADVAMDWHVRQGYHALAGPEPIQGTERCRTLEHRLSVHPATTSMQILGLLVEIWVLSTAA